MSDPIQEIQERLSKLEAQMAELTERLNASAAPVIPPPPRPAPLVAATQPVVVPPSVHVTVPPKPRPEPKPQNPIVVIAAVGAGIFLLGAIFFLHLAIQRGWIGPEMRLLMGFLMGLALSGFAAKMILGDSRKVGACLLLAGLGTLIFSFRVGAFSYHFFPPVIGFAGTGLATVFAGGLAARSRFSPVLSMALIAGLLAPIVFSEGGHHEVALAMYLALLLLAVLAVPYLSKVGARWGTVRWLALVGVWILLAVACGGCRSEDAGTLMALIGLHYGLAGLWIWLPGQDEIPTTPTILWFLATVITSSLIWWLWLDLNWMHEAFTAPVLAIALLNLLLVKPLRQRLGSRKADLGLLVLAGGHLALAIPIALDWKWVGPLWGALALGLAWAVSYAQEHPDWEEDEVRALRILAVGMALLATGRWLVAMVDFGFGYPAITPFFNRHFAEGLLAALAWLMLTKDQGSARVLGFLGVELVGTLTIALELAQLVRFSGGSSRAASIVITVVFAIHGAIQWLRSLSIEDETHRRGLAIAGYAWLAIGSVKLIVVDLAEADTMLRALAFLAVGAIFLGAALVANRARQRRREAE